METWKADLYDENSALQQAIAHQVIDRLAQRFPPPPLILDIGCGTGRVTQILLDAFPESKAIGIDRSEEMIAFANAHLADCAKTFRVDLAETLATIPSSTIDAITSFCCLHWVHDLPSAFQSMARALKPNGWIGLVFAAETGYDDPIDRAYAQAIGEAPWKDSFSQEKDAYGWNIVDAAAVRSMMQKNQFDVVLIEPLNFDFHFPHIQAFQRWIKASFQQLKTLPLDLQDSCSDRIARLYLQMTDQQQDGPCAYHIDSLMVMGSLI